ncbi:MAG: 30S ribosome-binding factor RbfA [Planctomycetes bacterium]|nr:30S ribosome-binding factor RbfA [Planctomycetota bacterium]
MVSERTIARLEARIHERAAHCLEFEVSDPRSSFITITRVELSHDVSSGKIHYSVLGDASDRSKAKHMLESAAGFIQRRVARVLDMRRMPHLKWIYDDSIENAAKLDQVIHEALQRDAEIHTKGHAAADVPPQPATDAAGESELGSEDGGSDGELKPEKRR